MKRLGVMLVIAGLTAWPASANWRFAPNTGLTGEAFVETGSGVRLSVECAEAGGPRVTINPDPRLEAGRALREEARFGVVVDGAVAEDLEMACFAVEGRTACVALPGLWDVWRLVAELRRAATIGLAFEGGVQDWTLRGSARAIARLGDCVEPL